MKTEYLSDDLFDEGHLKLFAPFRFCQLIFGSCRIDARDRFVTAPTWGQKAYTVIILILVAALQLYIICHYVSQLYEYPIVYHINVLFTALNSILYALNIIHLRFTNNERNVKFYIKTQKIDRKLKISDNNPCIIFLYNVNLCSVVFVIVMSLIVFFVVYIYNTELFVSFSGLFFCQLTSLIELMFCSNIIIYFYMRFRFINAIIRNHLKGLPYKKGRNTKFFIPTRSNMRYLVASLHDFSTSQIDDYLKDIFDAHLQFQELYRWQIIKWIDFMLLTLLTAVDLFMIIVICIRCEAFSSEIKDIKRLCTTILSLHYEGPLRDKARKMIKLIDEKPHHISIYDMWNMDASTMLNMINVVTTLLVTLLQFALL
nr:uncharacterized protein LOC116766386 [Danaus plexippus plexippus]